MQVAVTMATSHPVSAPMDGGLCKYLASKLHKDDKWYKLGIILGVPKVTIDKTIQKYSPNINLAVTVTLLIWWKWSKLELRDKLAQLMTALQNIQHHYLIEKISRITQWDNTDEIAEEQLYKRIEAVLQSENQDTEDGLCLIGLKPLTSEEEEEEERADDGLSENKYETKKGQTEGEKLPLTKYQQKTMQILANIIQKTDEFTVSDFRYYSCRLKNKVDLAKLYDEKRQNLLHLVVVHSRNGFATVLFEMGLWKVLSTQKCEGSTALETVQEFLNEKLWKEFVDISNCENSLSDIHIAARAGQLDRVTELLQAGVESDINATCYLGFTPLYFAVTSGNAEVVDIITKSGGDLSVIDPNGDNLLMRAAYLNHANIIDLLVRKHEMNPNRFGSHGKSALDIAAENAHNYSFDTLIACGAILHKSILPRACLSSRPHFLETLINEYDIDLHATNEDGENVLHIAALKGKIQSLNILLKHNINFLAVNRNNRNMLHFACKGGDEDMVKFVMKEACEYDCLEKMIEEQDVYDPIENGHIVRGLDNGWPVWHFVHVRRHLNCLFGRKNRGPGKINVVDYGTVIASDWGVGPSRNEEKSVKQLLKDRYKNPNAKKDLTPLMLAVLSRQYQIVPLLLKKCNLQKTDCFGMTVLHHACMRGHLPTVIQLIQHGANTEAKNMDEMSPLNLARKNDNIAVVNYLVGTKYITRAQKFVSDDLGRAHRMCNKKYMLELLLKGGDLRRYFLIILRDLTADINKVLYELDSSPILGESEIEIIL